MAIAEGSKVKCIDASIKPEALPFVIKYVPNWVKKGVTYTIRQICKNDGIVDGYLLEELVNPIVPCTIGSKTVLIETRFATWRFVEEEEIVQEEQVIQFQYN
jgi:hypothetical protein